MDPRTPPNCARCRNHYITIALIGHKRYCKYRACKCQKCCLTSERQHAMAKQTALRRAQTQDRHMIRTEVQIDGFQIERQPSNEAVPVAPVVHLLADVVVPAEIIHEDILAGAAGKDECVICLEGPKLIVAVPCGHRCFCTRCGPTAQEQFQSCPFCRADINSFLRIY